MNTIHTPTNKNVNATNLTALLASHCRGQGETSKLEELYQLNTETDVLTVAGLGAYSISADVRNAMFLKDLAATFKAWDDNKKLEHLDCLSGGFLGIGHRKVQLSASNEKTATPTSPLAKRSPADLTASEYRRNAVSLQLDVKNVDILLNLLDVSATISDKTTKAELSSILSEFTKLFFPIAAQDTYEIKLQNEIEAAKRFAALTEAGITDIVKTNLGNYSCTVPFSAITPALTALSAGGYTVTKSDNDLAALVVKLVFTEGASTI